METPGESVIDPCVGFIFSPTHEEIISIVKHKRSNPDFVVNEILEANLYDYEPDILRGLGSIQSDGKWYFFCQRNPVNPGSDRFRRSTQNGYWKATGKVLPIKAKATGEEIGTKRNLVFHLRFPGGREESTNWVMHEFSDENSTEDLVVCKIKEKKGKRKKGDRKRCISTKNKNKRAKKRCVSANNDVFQPEPPRSDAVENNYPERHYLPVSNFNDHVEDTLWLESWPLENLNGLNGSTYLDQTSFFKQLPILQGSSSSSVSTTGNAPEDEVLNSSFGSESEVEPPELLFGQNGHTRGFCGGDNSDVSTENFNAWVNRLFSNNTSEACPNYI